MGLQPVGHLLGDALDAAFLKGDLQPGSLQQLGVAGHACTAHKAQITRPCILVVVKAQQEELQRYLKLVRRAGLASYTELLQTAGLKVPFEEGSVKGIAQQMTRWLEEHQVG